MNEKKYNFKGSTDFVADFNAYVTIRTNGPFTVLTPDGDILGPNSSTTRVMTLFMRNSDVIIIDTDDNTHISLTISEAAPRGEVVSSESMVEIIPASEMSPFDRLRGELLAKIDAMAQNRDMDTWEDEEDYEVEDDEGGTPLTPYEYEVMKEEYLKEDDVMKSDTVESSTASTSESMTTPPLPQSNSEDATVQVEGSVAEQNS